jgi:hypothetical protein
MTGGQVASFAAAAGPQPERTIAAVVALVSEVRGTAATLVCGGEVVSPDPAVMAADVDRRVLEDLGPWLPGLVREALTDAVVRRRGGIHHTDPAVALAIARLALEGHDPVEVTVGDPSVGGGAFLLAVAELLAPHTTRADIVGRLGGVDVDPLAVAVTRAALELWADTPVDHHRFRTADFLAGIAFGDASLDVVVGNPPFLGQLKGETARTPTRSRQLRRRWAEVGGYVDESVLFLLAGLDEVRLGGTVALLQPVSMLSARDAAPVRRRMLRDGAISGFWFDGARAFGAGVDTCALVVRKGGGPEPVSRIIGAGGHRTSDHPPVTAADSWAGLVADLVGVPQVARPRGAVRLGDVARCTAGFRDEFYGLRDAVHEDRDGEFRLVTSGLIDPLACGWGERPCRYDRRRWVAPAVDLDRVDASVADWVRQRLRPKLVVASQTRTLEIAVDTDGTWIPCTPVISVEPAVDAPSLWHLAAALSSPQASAWLATETTGSALSRDALRVSAGRLADLPLPSVGPTWDAAADAARAAHLDASAERIRSLGSAAGAAYGGLDEQLLQWWTDRLPGANRHPS